MSSNITVYIDAPYPSQNADRLFASEAMQDPSMAAPFVRMRDYFNGKGIRVHTADFLRARKGLSKFNYYFSFGDVSNFQDSTLGDPSIGVIFGSFVAFETPLIQPIIYEKMDEIKDKFKYVYAYNKSLTGNSDKHQQLYFPVPYNEVQEPFWSNTTRNDKFVMVSGNHRPRRGYQNELYSERLKALRLLAKNNSIDLYGRGWKRLISRNSLWIDFWKSLNTIRKVYMGECNVKLDVLSKYTFSVCFENCRIEGYITEKIFDCFYAGCIPLYWGAPDVSNFIPKECLINVDDFGSLNEAIIFTQQLSPVSRENMKLAGKRFIDEHHKKYTDSIINIIENSLNDVNS
jgi:alpha(1,3/1,4) fucosyltransferase